MTVGTFGRWRFEAHIDLTCWMVGFNLGGVSFAAFYLHLGPFIVGVWRDVPR